MSRPFKSGPHGIRVTLSSEELVFLASLPELLAVVDEDPTDPAHSRLHVAAYPDDAAAQADLASITGPDLAAMRTADRDRFLESLKRAESGDRQLTPDEAEGWLKVLGDSRLALAAQLGIEEPGWENASNQGDPAHAALGFLSYLQSELVDTLMGNL